MAKRMWAMEVVGGDGKWMAVDLFASREAADQERAVYGRNGNHPARHRVREWRRVKEKAVPKMAVQESIKALTKVYQEMYQEFLASFPDSSTGKGAVPARPVGRNGTAIE